MLEQKLTYAVEEGLGFGYVPCRRINVVLTSPAWSNQYIYSSQDRLYCNLTYLLELVCTVVDDTPSD